MTDDIDPAVQEHYRQGVERDRLTTWGMWEATRTRELLDRFLPPAPAVVLDVGGAEGAYALPLAAAGYDVHLLDPWPPHIEAARGAADARPEAPLGSAQVGDARTLPYPDGSADAALLLGPLYHLIDREQRLRALHEALRALRPGGVLLAAAVSRFASTMSGIVSGDIADPRFDAVVAGDLRDGVHRNPDPSGRPDWFTLAYFHDPDELREEIGTAGFVDVRVLAVEGLVSMCPDAARDPARWEPLRRAVARVEAEPAVLGASAHLMAVARSPDTTTVRDGRAGTRRAAS